jgi:hypothetical protein
MQNSFYDESGDGSHQIQPTEISSNVQHVEKSWCSILKSWTPTDNKSFILSVTLLITLCIGVLQFVQSHDASVLQNAFWAACAYGGLSSLSEKIISAFPKTPKDKK